MIFEPLSGCLVVMADQVNAAQGLVVAVGKDVYDISPGDLIAFYSQPTVLVGKEPGPEGEDGKVYLGLDKQFVITKIVSRERR